MKNKAYISVFEKGLAIVLLVMSFTVSVSAQETIVGATGTAATGVSQARATTAEEIEAATCEEQKPKSIAECNKPSNGGWQAAAQIFAGVAGAAAGFMATDSGSDSSKSGQASQMCALAEMLNKLSSALNGGQNDTCMNAAKACEKVCDKEIKEHQQKWDEYSENPQTQHLANREKELEKRAKDNKDECIKKVEEQAQKAQQQQQANQSPGQGMSQCQQALNGDQEAEEPVDCSKDKFKGHPSCAGMSKDPGSLIAGNQDPFMTGSKDDTDFDLPLDENSSAFQNTGSDYGSGGGSGGGMGFMGSGGGSGGGESQKTGGAAGRSGVGALYGGSDGGGGGGGAWGSMAGDGKGGKGLSRLAKKKSDVKVPTQRKLAGHKLGAGEFGLSTDDIWTRVYLRTNTRCTKQLLSCSANRSTDPYGRK